jgi:hypothetical protein
VTDYDAAEVAAHRAAWVAALRSGNYRQAVSALRVDDERGPAYCCLGVAEDLRGATWQEVVDPEDPDAFCDATHHVERDPNELGETGETVLTAAGRRWLGVDEAAPYVVFRYEDEWSVESVTTLNDTYGYSFDQIADVVERQDEGWDGTEDWCRARLEALRAEEVAVP